VFFSLSSTLAPPFVRKSVWPVCTRLLSFFPGLHPRTVLIFPPPLVFPPRRFRASFQRSGRVSFLVAAAPSRPPAFSRPVLATGQVPLFTAAVTRFHTIFGTVFPCLAPPLQCRLLSWQGAVGSQTPEWVPFSRISFRSSKSVPVGLFASNGGALVDSPLPPLLSLICFFLPVPGFHLEFVGRRPGRPQLVCWRLLAAQAFSLFPPFPFFVV